MGAGMLAFDGLMNPFYQQMVIVPFYTMTKKV
jgi:hypothetical protein